jgi:hypothetical protein
VGAVSGKPKVYVICNPAVRRSEAWPKLRWVIGKRAKNATLVTYDDVFTGKDDYVANWPERLSALAGAVVVPSRWRGSLWIGHRAEAEAAHLAVTGKPVLVLGPSGLLRWADVCLSRPEGAPRFTPVLVGLPAAADALGVRGHQHV